MTECERCKDWQEMGLSSTCPSCDMIAEGIYNDELGEDLQDHSGSETEKK
jgi:hypothetical protein